MAQLQRPAHIDHGSDEVQRRGTEEAWAAAKAERKAATKAARDLSMSSPTASIETVKGACADGPCDLVGEGARPEEGGEEQAQVEGHRLGLAPRQ